MRATQRQPKQDYFSSLAFALDSGVMTEDEVRELFGEAALTEALAGRVNEGGE